MPERYSDANDNLVNFKPVAIGNLANDGRIVKTLRPKNCHHFSRAVRAASHQQSARRLRIAEQGAVGIDKSGGTRYFAAVAASVAAGSTCHATLRYEFAHTAY